MAEFVDVSESPYGADDGVTGDSGFVGALQKGAEDGAGRGVSFMTKTEGVDVAVDGGVVGDVVVASDGVWAMPVEVVLFDGVALGMAANAALTRMAARQSASGGTTLSVLFAVHVVLFCCLKREIRRDDSRFEIRKSIVENTYVKILESGLAGRRSSAER